MRSIKLFLITALLAAITLGNFLAAVQGYRTSTERAQNLLDMQLADTAALLAATLPTARAVAQQPSGRLAFQIWTQRGELVQRSSNAIETPITKFEAGYREENFADNRWRVLSHFDDVNRRWILVAERIDVRIELADSIVVQSIMPVILSLPLIAGIVWLIVGNGLSLVKTLATEVSQKRTDDLARLNIADPPVELEPVIAAINGLLRRLSDSIHRERRFSSDAAHELRTPLSALKVHVHNLKAEFPDRSEVWRGLDRDVRRLEHLIEQIMLLYRMSPEHYQANMQPIDVYALAQSVISDLYSQLDERQQVISLTGSPCTVTGDDASLRIMLANLISNASKYSPDDTDIIVHVEPGDFGVQMDVVDSGPGIPLGELNRVLDRFYRAGGDRHDSNVDGCGLGLAIAQHIADLHQAELSLFNNQSGTGLTVRVLFPGRMAASTMRESR